MISNSATTNVTVPAGVTMCLGLPVLDGFAPEFLSSFADTVTAFTKHAIDLGIAINTGDSVLVRSGNSVIGRFPANPEQTRLAFIDSDMPWKATDLLRMLAADRDVIAGSYGITALDWDKVLLAAMRGVAPSMWPHLAVGLNATLDLSNARD